MHGSWWTLRRSTSKTLIMRFLSLNTHGIVRGQRLYVKANLFIPVMILPSASGLPMTST